MNNICRICLEIGASVPLVNTVAETNTLQMFDKFVSCTAVQFSSEDMMPKALCSPCADKVDDAYSLRKQAQKSDANLRHRLSHVKIEHNNDSVWETESKMNLPLKIDTKREQDNNGNDSPYETNFYDNDMDNYKDVKFLGKEELDYKFEPLLRETIEKVSKSKTGTSSMAGSIKITKILNKKSIKEKCEYKDASERQYDVDIPIRGYFPMKLIQKKSNSLGDCPKKRKEPKLYNCRVCSKNFTHLRLYRCHMKVDHAGVVFKREKKYMCDECGGTFHDRYGLQMHKRSHTGDRQFICKVCNKAFVQQSNMDRHMAAVHLKEKPYQCQICPSRFADSSTLRDHTRNHAGLRSFPCGSCDKRFPKRFALLRHQLTHTKARPYTCKICGSNYTQSNDLKSHVKRTHVGVSTEKISDYCDKQVY